MIEYLYFILLILPFFLYISNSFLFSSITTILISFVNFIIIESSCTSFDCLFGPIIIWGACVFHIVLFLIKSYFYKLSKKRPVKIMSPDDNEKKDLADKKEIKNLKIMVFISFSVMIAMFFYSYFF